MDKTTRKMWGGYCLIGNGFSLWLHQSMLICLTDYKFFCFNGIPKLLYISKGLEEHETAQISFYNLDGTEHECHRADYMPLHNAELPSNFEEMKAIATQLSTSVNNSFVRVDLYSIENKIYFSELTFSPCSGFLPFEPEEWDEKFGEWLHLQL